MTNRISEYASKYESINVPGLPAMPAYVSQPNAGIAARATVIVAMELFGLTRHVRDVCDRLAAQGYLAVAPNFYHRLGGELEFPIDDEGRSRAFARLNAMSREDALADVAATIAWAADGRPPVAGLLGLSLGGHIAFLAATEFEFPLVAIFYAGWLTQSDIALSRPSPTLSLSASIRGRVLMFIGADDHLISPSERRRISDSLSECQVEHRLVVYPGVGHGFLADDRSQFDPEAATDAWHQTLTALEAASGTAA